MALRPGAGTESGGTVALQDSSGVNRVAIGGRGEVALASAAGQDVDLHAGKDVSLSASAEAGEIQFKHAGSASSGDVSMRVQKDKVVSHVPIQGVAFDSPSDQRIKQDIQNVDQDDILQRMQGLEIKKYRYTEQWRNVRGIEDKQVRGVIAQDVAQKFPEYVETTANYQLKDKNFALENFVQVNKQAIAIDLVAAMRRHPHVVAVQHAGARLLATVRRGGRAAGLILQSRHRCVDALHGTGSVLGEGVRERWA